jgi:hypothetical protein
LKLAQSGRDIRLNTLVQYHTYAGLLEGAPGQDINAALVQEAVDTARARLLTVGTPFLIKPIERPLDPEVRPSRGLPQRMRLPNIVCLADFFSMDPAGDDRDLFSSLPIVWFQDEFALPIDPNIEREIVAVDWDALATSWGP